MGALRPAALALLLAAHAPAAAQNVASWRPFVAEAARRFDVPVAWIERVMQAESAGRTRLGGRPITSRAGAMGLMQLMPATWAAMRARLGLGLDPYDPHDNILAGTLYLRMMRDRFGYPGLFGAYNAGPARYASALAKGVALPAETITYLRKVAGTIDRARAESKAREPSLLFVSQRGTEPPVQSEGPLKRAPDLFVVRHDQPSR